jgi:hypothetical protein
VIPQDIPLLLCSLYESISDSILIVTSTGRVMGRVIAYVTQYVLTPISRAWSVPITFNHNDMSVSTVSTVRVLNRLCVLL